MLWFLSKYGRVLGDSGSMITDSGIESWALKATGRDLESNYSNTKKGGEKKKAGWQPGDKPASQTIEMTTSAGIGVI